MGKGCGVKEPRSGEMIPITSGTGHIMEGRGMVAAMDMQCPRMIQTCMLQLQLMVLLSMGTPTITGNKPSFTGTDF